MNNAKDTIISQCLALANKALGSSWSFHNSSEALFWFGSVLKVDPQNAAARLGSARVYQYIASQPWWHNDVSLAKSAASKALAMLEEPIRPRSVEESREKALVCGQIYSAIGQPNVAKRYLNEGITIDPVHSSGHYFLHFNNIFIDPKSDRILIGLNEAVELAEAGGSQRRLAAALYFRGFANTLFSNYHEAIKDLKRSMANNPGYGSANLALIAAVSLARRKETYNVVRCFKERYPNFSTDVLDYMWVDRSSCTKYHRFVRPIVDIVKVKLRSEGLQKSEASLLARSSGATSAPSPTSTTVGGL
jgi:tetratricopeptide (TPR) repeat protein